jgi:hypothetical protein
MFMFSVVLVGCCATVILWVVYHFPDGDGDRSHQRAKYSEEGPGANIFFLSIAACPSVQMRV